MIRDLLGRLTAPFYSLPLLRRGIGLRLAAMLGLALAFCGGGGLPAYAAPPTGTAVTGPGSVIKETDGAWQLSCRTPPGTRQEKCALVQSVTAENRPNIGLTVVFYQAIGDDKKLLRVVVPLGVLLPTGLGLKIDGKDVGNAPFLKCSKNGCIAEVVLQPSVIKKMETGKQAVFIIYDTYESGIGIPISLKGFAQGLRGVK